jgi:hypothetical protein
MLASFIHPPSIEEGKRRIELDTILPQKSIAGAAAIFQSHAFSMIYIRAETMYVTLVLDSADNWR